jgi:hypothetical protein
MTYFDKNYKFDTSLYDFGMSNEIIYSKVNENENILSDDGLKTKRQVVFIHVYHHWGDESWNVWRWLAQK